MAATSTSREPMEISLKEIDSEVGDTGSVSGISPENARELHESLLDDDITPRPPLLPADMSLEQLASIVFSLKRRVSSQEKRISALEREERVATTLTHTYRRRSSTSSSGPGGKLSPVLSNTPIKPNVTKARNRTRPAPPPSAVRTPTARQAVGPPATLTPVPATKAASTGRRTPPKSKHAPKKSMGRATPTPPRVSRPGPARSRLSAATSSSSARARSTGAAPGASRKPPLPKFDRSAAATRTPPKKGRPASRSSVGERGRKASGASSSAAAAGKAAAARGGGGGTIGRTSAGRASSRTPLRSSSSAKPPSSGTPDGQSPRGRLSSHSVSQRSLSRGSPRPRLPHDFGASGSPGPADLSPLSPRLKRQHQDLEDLLKNRTVWSLSSDWNKVCSKMKRIVDWVVQHPDRFAERSTHGLFATAVDAVLVRNESTLIVRVTAELMRLFHFNRTGVDLTSAAANGAETDDDTRSVTSTGTAVGHVVPSTHVEINRYLVHRLVERFLEVCLSRQSQAHGQAMRQNVWYFLADWTRYERKFLEQVLAFHEASRRDGQRHALCLFVALQFLRNWRSGPMLLWADRPERKPTSLFERIHEAVERSTAPGRHGPDFAKAFTELKRRIEGELFVVSGGEFGEDFGDDVVPVEELAFAMHLIAELPVGAPVVAADVVEKVPAVAATVTPPTASTDVPDVLDKGVAGVTAGTGAPSSGDLGAAGAATPTGETPDGAEAEAGAPPAPASDAAVSVTVAAAESSAENAPPSPA